IEQVNQAITQMDQVTQQNAALVEEASAAAQSMREQAGELVQAVSVFKLAADTQAAQQVIARARSGANARPALPAPRRIAAARPARSRAITAAVAAVEEADWKEF
ncbi:MAG TPA: methyl-accepting chemotaxis protein, partial [Ramlibacter sp.]|nr:methyl-accepting chemotaxis protein [Ramlibacter sp.]